MDGVGPALHGTAAAAALSDVWSDWVARWQLDITEHDDHLHYAAAIYDGAENFGRGELNNAAGGDN